MPANLSEVTAIAAGAYHSLALKNDGTIVAWGANFNGQTNVPANLNGVAVIAAGGAHSLALGVGNAPPTIAASNVTRIAGSPSSNAQIAKVSDTQDASTALQINASLQSGSGVTVSNISVDVNGNVTADVQTACGASTSTFTLTVTDSGTLSASVLLTVTVNDNPVPALAYPANPGAVYGTGLIINALAPPTDNGSIQSIKVQSVVPALNSGITVDNAGVVTVASTVPANIYTVTIRATDDCNAYTDATFTLGIAKAMPVLMWNNPADITYGTALSATQLNATANVAGSFSYLPASGTVLNAGNGQMLTVNFTPTDTNYATASKQVTISVLKTPLTVVVNNAYRNQGEANPPFSGSLLGLTNGDVITASYSTTANVGSVPGDYPITALLSDPGNRLSNYQVTNPSGTLTILNSCGITVNPATLPAATRGTPFVQVLSASPTGSYAFSLLAGTLPPGLSLVNVLGIYSLRGTPTTAGSYQFTLKASKNNSTCVSARTYTLVVP